MLKKVGYGELCQVYYDEHSQGIQGDENAIGVNWNKHESCCSLPTLDDVVGWLRETKGWHVGMEPIYHNRSCWQAYVVAVPLLELHDCVIADTYDEALSEGISMILKNKTNAQ